MLRITSTRAPAAAAAIARAATAATGSSAQSAEGSTRTRFCRASASPSQTGSSAAAPEHGIGGGHGGRRLDRRRPFDHRSAPAACGAASGTWCEQARAQVGTERGTHEQRNAAEAALAEDRLAQKLTHVGVAAVHLVDDEQVAGDGATLRCA